MYRHQLASYSPISLGAAISGIPAILGIVRDPRTSLARRLRADFLSEEVLLCGSGTQALQLAIECSVRGRREQRIVALPAFGCFDLVSAAIGAGVFVSLYDVDPNTLAPDFQSLTRVLAAGVSSCIVTPLYGLALPWDEFETLAVGYGVPLIEDAAQGNGASWRGRPVGSSGWISCLSFGRGKGWTGGSGGAVLTRQAQDVPGADVLKASARGEIKNVVSLVAQWAMGRPRLYGLARSIPWLSLGETKYRSAVSPREMSRAAAATIQYTGRAAGRESERRRANATALLSRLKGRPGLVALPPPADSQPGYTRLAIRLTKGLGSGPLPPSVRRIGIERSYPHSLAKLPAAAPWLRGPEHDWAGADTLADQLITLPTHSFLTARDLDEIAKRVIALAAGS